MVSGQAFNGVAREEEEDDLQHPASDILTPEEDDWRHPKQGPYPQSWSDYNADSLVTSYLTSSLDPNATASALTTPINDFLTSGFPRADSSPPEPEDIWSALLRQARKHHPLSPTISALVALVAAIKASSPSPPTFKEAQQWQRLPDFSITVRGEWNRTVSSDANDDDAERWSCNPLQWASMNAFVARCTVAGVADYKLYAIWALRDALEDIPGERSLVGHVADLDHYVPAAA
ncbi:MAG: hypothetical protein Q9177_005759, partial [Variospora cf. flavescens]